jgi:spoIIIJ-associated protein
MTEIFTAETVEEAKERAAAVFGRKVIEIKFEIVNEGKKGFFGFGKSEAVVKATVDDEPAIKEVEIAVELPVKVAEIINDSAVSEETSSEGTSEVIAEDEDEYSIENFELVEDELLVHPKVKIAKDYITSIFRAMDVDVKFTVYQNETAAVINIDSDNNGSVIGRRGETLDAIQYLCSIIANKGDKDYFRITIDCFGYRKKRRETLEQLAGKVAKSVLRTGRSQPLEPMNPYERRVIHSAISKIDGVSSRSVGEEPYRKIIISSNNPAKRNAGGNRKRDNRRNDRHSRHNRRDNFEPRAIDLSTSFEKDYKKPRPEDSIEGGLYGKIEL